MPKIIQKIEKNACVALKIGKARWVTARFVSYSPTGGIIVLIDAGDRVEVPVERASYVVPLLDKYYPPSATELNAAQVEELTVPAETRFANAPANGRRVVYKKSENLFYPGTVSGTSGNFIYVVLDSDEIQSPIKVTLEDSKIEGVIDAKADAETRSATGLTNEQAKKLTTPSYSKLLRAVQQLADAENSSTGNELSILCAAVVRQCRLIGNSTPPSTQSPSVYTVVPQDARALKRTLQERRVTLPKAEFSIWDAAPSTTSQRIGTRSFGSVAEWRPPKGSIAIDLSALTLEMLRNKVACSKLNKRETVQLSNLNRVYTQTPKYLLSHAPDSAYISGILTTNKSLIKQLRMMDIEFVSDSATNVVYMRLFQIQNSLDELGLQ